MYRKASQLGEFNLDEGLAALAEQAPKGNIALDSLPLASAYTPMQKWNGTYDGTLALERGTIFPELDLPFNGRGVK